MFLLIYQLFSSIHAQLASQKKKKKLQLVCVQDPNMFGKCNKYSKRIGLKNIFKKQFMIFFFNFPLRVCLDTAYFIETEKLLLKVP